MSSIYYQKFWLATKAELEDLRLKDIVIQELGHKVEPNLMIEHLLGLYAKYVLIVSKLSTIYDQLYHVQRRQTIKKVLDATICRMAELKSYLETMQLSIYQFVDSTLMELKITAKDFDIICPGYFPLRPEQIQELIDRVESGETIYVKPEPVTEPSVISHPVEVMAVQEEVAKKDAKPIVQEDDYDDDEEEEETEIDEDANLTPEEREEKRKWEAFQSIVKLIQKHERARQHRVLFILTLRINDLKKRGATKTTEEQKLQRDKDVRRIQKLWRYRTAQKRMKLRENRLRTCIGMIQGEHLTQNIEKQKEVELHRRFTRKLYEKEMKERKVIEKTRALAFRSPCIMEDISDEIRDWFYDWYQNTKTFSRFPTADEGGTVLVLTLEIPCLEEYLEEQEKKRALEELYAANPELKRKDEEAKRKEKLREKERKKQEKKMKKEGKSVPPPPFQLTATEAFVNMQQGLDEYKGIWEIRDEENKFYTDFIIDDAYKDVHLELRQIVDEAMRLELRLLLMAQAADSGVPFKEPKEKKKRRRGKKNKDITAKRQTEDLFQELIDNGIIRSYQRTFLKEFEGDYNYCGFETRNADLDPWPCLGDVRQVVLTKCILPLGTPGSPKDKSVCIIGPRQSGKHMLIDAICTETGAVLFDISPHILINKYPGKKGNKMLYHLLNKMSRILQPSVIFIDGGEKPFYTKVPPAERMLDPKRMKKIQKEIVNKITPMDQVMLITISKQPWTAAVRDFKKCYSSFIIVPRTDYGSLYQFWRKVLLKYHGIDREFDFSSLAKATIGYPFPYIRETIEKLFSVPRIIRFKYDPMTPHEILNALLNGGTEPVNDEENAQFINWYYGSTEFGVKKTAVMKEIAEMKAKEEAMKLAEAKKTKKK